MPSFPPSPLGGLRGVKCQARSKTQCAHRRGGRRAARPEQYRKRKARCHPEAAAAEGPLWKTPDNKLDVKPIVILNAVKDLLQRPNPVMRIPTQQNHTKLTNTQTQSAFNLLKQAGFAILLLVVSLPYGSSHGCDLVVDRAMQFGREGDDRVEDLLRLGENSFVICGEYFPGGAVQSGFISRIDENQIQWTIFLGDSGVTYVYSMDTLDANTVAFSGASYRRAFGYKSVVGAASTDGQLLWLRFYDELNAWKAFDICATHDTTLVIAGGKPFADFQQDAVVFKTDSVGHLLWSRAFGGPASEHFEAIAVLSNGEIVAAGTGNDPVDLVRRILIAKVTASGDSVWASYVGEESGMTGRSIAVAYDTLIAVVAGFTRPGMQGQVQIVAADTSGVLRWSVEFGEDYDDLAFDIGFDRHRNHLVYCGAKRTRFDAPFNVGIGVTDLYGYAVDSLVIEDTLWTTGTSLVVEDSCKLLVGGGRWQGYWDRIDDPYIIRLVNDVSGGIPTFPVNATELQTSLFPNPFNSTTTLRMDLPIGTRNVKLTVTNVLGQTVEQREIEVLAPRVDINLSLDNHPSGIYFAQAQALNKTQTTKLVLLK